MLAGPPGDEHHDPQRPDVFAHREGENRGQVPYGRFRAAQRDDPRTNLPHSRSNVHSFEFDPPWSKSTDSELSNAVSSVSIPNSVAYTAHTKSALFDFIFSMENVIAKMTQNTNDCFLPLHSTDRIGVVDDDFSLH